MSNGRTVISLIEAREGIRINENRLSMRLQDRIRQVDAMLVVFDQLKQEVVLMAQARRRRLMILFGSLVFGVVGFGFGLNGVFQGYLDFVGVVLSFGASLGIFVVDYYILGLERKLHWKERRNSKELNGLTLDLDASLDRIYHEVVSEQNALRRAAADRYLLDQR